MTEIQSFTRGIGLFLSGMVIAAIAANYGIQEECHRHGSAQFFNGSIKCEVNK